MNVLPLPWVTKLIDRFAILYGSKFTEQWKGVDPEELRQAWAEELAGYTGEELRHGLEACKTKTWPPTLPEFTQLCRPGLDNERSYLEAVEQMQIRHRSGGDVWSTPAVYWAAARIGNDIQTNPYQAMKARWAATLDKVRSEISQGLLPNAVPVKRGELPPPRKTSIPQEEAKAKIAAMIAQISPPTDHKAWAKKIIANPKNYPEISLKFAKEALEGDSGYT